MKAFVVAIVGLGLFTSATSRASMQTDLARELDDAKALYQGANFIRAVQALGAVARVLEEEPRSRETDALRVDAHLHLGLTYFALQDSDAAKESFTNVVQLRPNYALDEQRYPSRVRALFEEARREMDLATAPPMPPRPPDVNAYELLYENWSFIAPLDGDSDRITREDLEALRNTPSVARRNPELASASEYFLDNPTFFDRADVGKGNRYNLGGSGELDGEISREDLMHSIEWGDRPPLGRFDPNNPTPVDAARTFLHWFELLDIGAGRGEIDGTISYRDLRDFRARNPGAPEELLEAVSYVLDNELVLAQFDSANDSDGDVDEKISLGDLERVR